jgi:hypothetical protein
MKFIIEETAEARINDDDRRRLVPAAGRVTAVALPPRAIFRDAERNLGEDLEDELKLLPGPDLLDDIPDDEADMRTLKHIYDKNPQILAKFLASIGL